MFCPFCMARDAEFAERTVGGSTDLYCDKCPDDGQNYRPPLPPEYVEGYGSHLPVPVGLVGLKAHGKTSFLAGLSWELMDGGLKNWAGMAYKPIGLGSLGRLRDDVTTLADGRVPNLTAPTESPAPHISRFSGLPELGAVQAIFYDNGGEPFDGDAADLDEVRNYYRYLTKFSAVAWFVSIPKLEEQGGPMASLALKQFLSLYTEAMLTSGAPCKRQSLLVVLSMAEQLDAVTLPAAVKGVLKAERPPPEGYPLAYLEELSSQTRQWLLDYDRSGSSSIVRDTEAQFAQVRYCVTAGLGKDAAGLKTGPPAPRGVLLPLYWLAWLQLPRVTVRTAAGDERSFVSLAEAVRAAPEGAAVRLGPGDFELDDTLTIDKPLSFAGAGMRESRVVSRAGGAAVAVAADFTCEGVGFACVGERQANVLVALPQRGGLSLALKGCRFAGARGEGVGKFAALRGAGVLLGPNAKAEVTGCEFRGNAAQGVLVCGATDVRLEKNLCAGNDYGIMFVNGAAGVAVGNRLLGNRRIGVEVRNRCRVRVEGGVCADGGEAGVRFRDESSGSVARCECRGNRAGVVVRDAASAELRHNKCHGSTRGAGVELATAGAVTAAANVCERNAGDGIEATGAGPVTLADNDCRDNQGSGMTFGPGTEGTAANNRCTGNGKHGVRAAGGSRVAVAKGNVCAGNGERQTCDERRGPWRWVALAAAALALAGAAAWWGLT